MNCAFQNSFLKPNFEKILQVNKLCFKQNSKNLLYQMKQITDTKQQIQDSVVIQLPYLVLQVLFLIDELSNKRIVQKIARPIQKEQKTRIINEANKVLQQVKLKMDFIKHSCSKFSTKNEKTDISYLKDGILVEEEIMLHIWKQGIRKIQIKLTNFYKERLSNFQKVNRLAGLNFKILKIDSNQWLGQCMKKTRGFCWCG